MVQELILTQPTSASRLIYWLVGASCSQSIARPLTHQILGGEKTDQY